MKLRSSLSRPVVILAGLSMVLAATAYAQLEGGDRGIAPIDSSSTYEVTGIAVDVAAGDADTARYQGWRLAQEKGWKALWASTHHVPQSEAPDLPDSTLDGIVAGIVVDDEEIGPHRYIATLGVLFDRARTSQLLGGVQGQVHRSAAMLVIPVLITGSTFTSFESRNEWQRAWARFRTGSSAIDYVRPVGNGIDPLLLNAEQARRPGRGWWRMILDQYGAADVVVPEVHMKRVYPGGPVVATFTARHGPDGTILDRFTLRVERSTLIPKLLDEGVRRIDEAYTRALDAGLMRPDPSLIAEEPQLPATVADQIEQQNSEAALSTPQQPSTPIPVGAASTYSIQVETPSSASVTQAEVSVSRIPGVTSALTTSLALGGTSVMRVTFVGDSAALQAALQAQGWSVQGSGNSLRISRAAPRPAAPEQD